MPYTRDSYKARLQLTFDNLTYYSDSDFNDSIQDGYDEISAFSGLYLRSTVVPFVPLLTYYDLLGTIPDYLGLIAIFNTGYNRWMIPSSVRKFNIDRIDWESAYGVPYYFSVVSHRFMAIYKKPSVPNYGNMYIFYHASAPSLGPSDLLAIPDSDITVMEDYNIVDLWEQNQEWNKAGSHFEAYVKNLRRLKTWIKNNRQPDRAPILKG
jgi:hypothetical protein